MEELKTLFQKSDWKTEKHVPVIEIITASKNEQTKITVTVGKEIPHPNTTAHHIKWITLYFKTKADKFPYEIGKQSFSAHGESTQGPDTSSIYTDPHATFTFKTDKSGTIYASSYCNIHGLWENSIDLNID